MKKSIMYNLFTLAAIFLCISCAHRGNKSAALEDDLSQETSNVAPEVNAEEKNITSLDASKEEATKVEAQVAGNTETPVSPDMNSSESKQDDAQLNLAVKQTEAPAENSEKAADDAVSSMLALGNNEKSLALEEINKVDVVPTVAAAEPILVATEDKVNADLVTSETAVTESLNNDSIPAPGRERELSNDSKVNVDSGIETEPVPAPNKKVRPKQGSENKSKKNRIETVDYSKAKPVVVATQQSAPQIKTPQTTLPSAPVAAAVVVEGKKAEPKLASAEISDFMREHYLAMGILVLFSLLIAYKMTRPSAAKQDENFPL